MRFRYASLALALCGFLGGPVAAETPTAAAARALSDPAAVAQVLEALDRLGLRSGQEIALPTGEKASVVRLEFGTTDDAVFPVLSVYLPAMANPQAWTETGIAALKSDQDAVCARYGASLRNVLAAVLPSLVTDDMAVIFRDKPSAPQGTVHVLKKYGSVYKVSDAGCVRPY